MTETKARVGEDHPAPKSAVAEAKAAVAGFLNAFKGFQEDVKISFQQQEERMTMLDRKTMTYARPALSAHAEPEVPHKKAHANGSPGLYGFAPQEMRVAIDNIRVTAN